MRRFEAQHIVNKKNHFVKAFCSLFKKIILNLYINSSGSIIDTYPKFSQVVEYKF